MPDRKSENALQIRLPNHFGGARMGTSNNRLSILSVGYSNVIYDSQLEAAVSQNLKDSVRYRGGSTRDQLVIVSGEAVLRQKNQNL